METRKILDCLSSCGAPIHFRFLSFSPSNFPEGFPSSVYCLWVTASVLVRHCNMSEPTVSSPVSCLILLFSLSNTSSLDPGNMLRFLENNTNIPSRIVVCVCVCVCVCLSFQFIKLNDCILCSPYNLPSMTLSKC